MFVWSNDDLDENICDRAIIFMYKKKTKNINNNDIDNKIYI